MSVLKIKDQNNNWTQIPTIKGDKGDPFTYADFTTEQLESLKGKDGISPTVSVASDTSDDYRLSFTDETHTVTTPNLIPEAEKVLSVYPTDAASGAVASFPDGADNIPLKSCIVQIEPVQDLHGYDHPWPAGGGKNQWDEQWEVGGLSSGTGQPVSSSTQIRSVDFCKCLPSTQYAKIAPTTSQVNIFWYDADKQYISVSGGGGNNPYYVVTSPSNAYYFKIRTEDAYGTTYKNDIAVNYPSTNTSYAPYENICPISGWTGCEVQRTGKNVWNGELINGYVDLSDYVTVGETYTVTAEMINSATLTYCYIRKKKPSESEYTNVGYVIANTTVSAKTFTVEAGYKYYIYCNSSYINVKNVMLELGSTATPYEPYTGQTYPITFPTEAGIVYGGYVDVLNGELTLTNYFCTPDNAKRITYGIDAQSNLPYAFFSFTQSGSAVALSSRTLCSMYKAGATSNVDKALRMWTSEADIWDSDLDVTSLDTVKAYFADLIIVYPIATPIEIQLEAHTINSLLGQNNIWADTGDTEVEYRADVTKYIDRKITEAVSALT